MPENKGFYYVTYELKNISLGITYSDIISIGASSSSYNLYAYIGEDNLLLSKYRTSPLSGATLSWRPGVNTIYNDGGQEGYVIAGDTTSLGLTNRTYGGSAGVVPSNTPTFWRAERTYSATGQETNLILVGNRIPTYVAPSNPRTATTARGVRIFLDSSYTKLMEPRTFITQPAHQELSYYLDFHEPDCWDHISSQMNSIWYPYSTGGGGYTSVFRGTDYIERYSIPFTTDVSDSGGYIEFTPSYYKNYASILIDPIYFVDGGSLTWMFWIYPTDFSFGGDQYIAQIGASYSTSYDFTKEYALAINANNSTIGLKDNSGSFVSGSSLGITINTWYHVSLRINRLTGEAIIHLNANLPTYNGTTTGTFSSGAIPRNQNGVTIGCLASTFDTQTNDKPFYGRISEFQLYSDPLSDDQIQRNFYATRFRHGFTVDKGYQ